MKLYLVCLFLNGLKDAERDVRTLKMMQGVGDHGLLKIPNICQIHLPNSQTLSNDPWSLRCDAASLGDFLI